MINELYYLDLYYLFGKIHFEESDIQELEYILDKRNYLTEQLKNLV